MSVYKYEPWEQIDVEDTSTEFRHHEHGKCQYRPVIGPRGEVDFFCISHSRNSPSPVVAMRLCGDEKIILNHLLPGGGCIQQASKVVWGDTVPREVEKFPLIHKARETTAIIRDDLSSNRFVGYWPIACGRCESEVQYSLRPVYWRNDPAMLRLYFLMECPNCKGQTIVSFKTSDEFIACECERHPVTMPLPPVRGWANSGTWTGVGGGRRGRFTA